MRKPATKWQIASTFIALSESSDPRKIPVSAISDALGINRKTFYYHFDNKETLINWIFRRDLGRMLKNMFPQSQLVFEPKDSTPYANYPYYVFVESPCGGLDHDTFFLALSKCLSERKGYYAQILKTTETGGFYHYLTQLYIKEIHKDILHIFNGEKLGDEAADFLAELFTAAFLGQIANRIVSPCRCRNLEEIAPFNNIIHDSLFLILNTGKAKGGSCQPCCPSCDQPRLQARPSSPPDAPPSSHARAFLSRASRSTTAASPRSVK